MVSQSDEQLPGCPRHQTMVLPGARFTWNVTVESRHAPASPLPVEPPVLMAPPVRIVPPVAPPARSLASPDRAGRRRIAAGPDRVAAHRPASAGRTSRGCGTAAVHGTTTAACASRSRARTLTPHSPFAKSKTSRRHSTAHILAPARSASRAAVRAACAGAPGFAWTKCATRAARQPVPCPAARRPTASACSAPTRSQTRLVATRQADQASYDQGRNAR